MSVIIVILSYFMLSNMLFSGYIIVKKIPCNSDNKCMESMPIDDVNAKALYSLMIDHTWPTSGAHIDINKGISEKKHLEDLLAKNNDLKDKYNYIWVPDTIQDLHCASTLLEEKNYRENGPSGLIIKDYLTYYKEIKKFLEMNNSNAQVSEMKEAKENNEAYLDFEKYFREYNMVGEKAYLRCNIALTNLLLNKKYSKSPNEKAIDELFENKESAKEIRALIANLYDKQLRIRQDNNELGKDSSLNRKIVGVQDKELSAKNDTLLDQVISIEVKNNKQNLGLLFRGSNGWQTVDGKYFLDYPAAGHTLSFGNSLYAGLFRESTTINSSSYKMACAVNYFMDKRFGYAVSIDRSNDKIARELFEIAPLGLIGRLFGSGEYWHSRTKIGIKGVKDLRIEGIFMPQSLSFFKEENYLVNQNYTPEQLSLMIADYIAKNAIVIDSMGKIISKTEATKAIDTQKTIVKQIGEGIPLDKIFAK